MHLSDYLVSSYSHSCLLGLLCGILLTILSGILCQGVVQDIPSASCPSHIVQAEYTYLLLFQHHYFHPDRIFHSCIVLYLSCYLFKCIFIEMRSSNFQRKYLQRNVAKETKPGHPLPLKLKHF